MYVPVLIHAQAREERIDDSTGGIQFETELNWQQIKEKAKASNKYIFMDCYATWCGPCKEMDRLVYPVAKVGNYMNERFISIKVQMDVTQSDNEGIKRWHNNAAAIQKQYNISGFPTYLFFSPYGKLVHRYSGAISVDQFLTVAANATSGEKQYYTLLENYQNGVKNYDLIPYMINVAKRIGDEYTVKHLSLDFLQNYLYKQPEATWLRKQNIEIMAGAVDLINSKEKAFDLFYRQPEKVDKVMWKGYAQAITDWIISKEEVVGKLYKNGKPAVDRPDWEQITTTIAQKYSKEVAARNILNAQLRWYEEKRDWPKVVKYTIQQKERYGLDTAGIGKSMLNNLIWELIFQHSNDKAALNKGIAWMELLIQAEPDQPEWLDTYANLLYKVGRKNEAITWEEKAILVVREKINEIKEHTKTLETKAEVIFQNDNIKRLESQLQAFQEVIAKIKQGEPTWPVE
jgi:thioredoxin-related protein